MAPTSTRSSSISSSSTTGSSSKTMTGGVKKKFGCNFPNCGKSFSRSEHLHRHALNHKDGNNTCLRCSAHFRRRDLLDRHMARHKEKDDEAGGPGLGLLATRKRLWRDSDGNIVNSRRPSVYATQTSTNGQAAGAKRRQLSRLERKSSTTTTSSSTSSHSGTDRKASIFSPTTSVSTSSPMSRTISTSSSTIIVDTKASKLPIDPKIEMVEEDEVDQDSWLALPSPPLSHSHSHSDSGSSLQSPQSTHFEDHDELEVNLDPEPEISEFDTLYEDTWAPISHSHSPSHPRTTSATLYPPLPTPASTTAPFQTFMGAMAELPYDDIFKPSAGMYDWQAWNSQVLMSQSRCREEKYDPMLRGGVDESTGGASVGIAGLKRGFGLGLGTLC